MLIFLKLLATLFTAILIPVYWIHYGPQNFLWLSDIGLFLTVGGLWLESSLLISIAGVAILPLEITWMVDFILHMLTGNSPIGLTGYMFDSQLPLYLRGISLFHIALPIIWIYLLARWGYDSRAWKYATILCIIIFTATYALNDPFENINLIFSPTFHQMTWITPHEWFIGQVVFLPLLVFWPMHKMLQAIFKKCRVCS
jgi:hypothetical protein